MSSLSQHRTSSNTYHPPCADKILHFRDLGTPETRIEATTVFWIGKQEVCGVKKGWIDHEKEYKLWKQSQPGTKKNECDLFSEYSSDTATARHVSDLKRVRKYVLQEAGLSPDLEESVCIQGMQGLEVYDGSLQHKQRMLDAARKLDRERLGKGKNGGPQNMKDWCDERKEHKRNQSNRKERSITKWGRASQV